MPLTNDRMRAVDSACRLLLRGVSVTALPVSTLRDDIVAGRIAAYPIADGDFQRMLYLAHPADRPQSAAVAEISQILVAEMNSLIGLGLFEIPMLQQHKDQAKRRR